LAFVKAQTVTISGTLVFYQDTNQYSVSDKSIIMQFSNKLGKPVLSRIGELRYKS